MANQSVQPVQIKSAPASGLYAYNQVVPSGFATVNVAHKKEKASISSIFSWKKDKPRTGAVEQQPPPPTLYGTAFHAPAYPAVVQYAPNYMIDSNPKFMHYGNHPSMYNPSPYPSTIHATIRYLPNHKQRSNLLATNWEPAAYPNATYPHHQSLATHPSVGQQPITLQHEITYSEQITIAPSPCHHHCQTACLATSKNQSCKCYSANEKQNYFFVPNSSLLESSTKLHNRSTDCMAGKRSLQSRHGSISGSRSHHDLAAEVAKPSGKKKSGGGGTTTKFAATVNERFLRIFKKSIKEPFNAVKSRKSILDCDLTAYDLVEADSATANDDQSPVVKPDALPAKPANLDSSLEEEQLEAENRFESNFLQAKAKQKQHYYSAFKERRAAEEAPNGTSSRPVASNSLNYNSDNYLNNKNSNRKDKTTKTNNDEEDRWTSAYASLGAKAPKSGSVSAATSKFNSCRIAGQGMKFSKRMSILESDLSKEFLREELSEDEDLNRFDRYAQNFTELDKRERRTNCGKSNKLNSRLNDGLNNFRLFSSAGSRTNSSIPNLPDPDYDTGEDEEDDRQTLTAFSRSTPDLEQATGGLSPENEQRKRPTLTNTTSLHNLDSRSLKERPCLPPPLPPLPKARSQQLNSAPTGMQSSSPSSSTYSSINSNVKSILKKSNPNLILLEHLKTADLLDRTSKEAKQLAFNGDKLSSAEDGKLTKRCSSTKTVSTFKSTAAACNYQLQQQQKKLEDFKPKKQVHFTRSSLNDELIVEHIDNQELIEEEGIYDDILTARLKQPTDGNEEASNEEKNDAAGDCTPEGKVEDDNKLESKSFLKLSDSERAYLNESPESKSPDSDSGHSDAPDKSRVASTGKSNEIKERPSFWENQSSQLPKVNSNFEFKRDHNTSELDRYFSNAKLRNGDLDELQSTALIKQNRPAATESSSTLLRQLMHNSSGEQRPEKSAQAPRSKSAGERNATNDKSLDLLQSLTQSANLSTNLSNLTQSKSSAKSTSAHPKSSADSNGFKEDSLFNRQLPDNDEQQQMSPSSSSSTSAYVSLYASSSFSSAGSSSSNYSTSGFNSNNENAKEASSSSDSSSKKISRSAILDSLINRKHNNKLLDKPFDKSLLKAAEQTPPQSKADSKSEGKANKIVIDVSMNENNNYDSLNQSIQNEHIYEELEACRFEKEINIIDNLNNNLNSVKKSIFEGASKDQIIEYLVDAKERIQELLINNYNDQYSSQNKFSSLSASCYNIASSRTNRRNRVSNLSNVSSDSSSSSDILLTNSMSNSIGQHLERNDSGVGTETSKPSLDIRISKSEACLNELIDNHIVHPHFDDPLEEEREEAAMLSRTKASQSTTNDSGADEQTCVDCEQNICAEVNEKTGQVYYPLLCTQCDKRRAERKEIISEFVDTEFKYGRDLRIIRDQFYTPMEVAGFLTKDQLKGVFLNLEELIQVNSNFSEKLQDALDIATEQGDEDYTTVDIGKLFMEFCGMLKSFETYCIKQASASRLLNSLEKEKELLRLFLRVSQMDNALLRRMNLNAFLMVPVQRCTKYPLLLNRLLKVTPYHHNDRARLKEAQLKTEMYLEQINQQTKGTMPNKIWRRISNLSNNSTSKRSNLELGDLGDVKLKKFNSSVRELFKQAFKSRS